MTLLTLTETATLLKVSPSTVRRLPLPRAKVGGQVRYDLADLEAYVQSRKAGGVQPVVITQTLPPFVVDGTAMIPATVAPRTVKHRSPLFAIGGKR